MASTSEPGAEAAASLAAASLALDEGDAALAQENFSLAIARYNDAFSIHGVPPQVLGRISLRRCIAYLRRSRSNAREDTDVAWAVTEGLLAVDHAPCAKAYLEHSRALCALAEESTEPDVALHAAEKAITETDRGLCLAPGDVELTSQRAEATRILAARKRRPTARCDVCSQPSSHRCGRCGRASYCSAGCQRKHWLEHKKTCAPPSRPVSVVSPSAAGGAPPPPPSTEVPFAKAQTHSYYPASPVRSRLVTDASVAGIKARCASLPKVPHYAALCAESVGLKASPILKTSTVSPFLSLIITDPFVGVCTAIGLGVSPDLQIQSPCPIHCRDELTSILSRCAITGEVEAATTLLAAGARVDWGRPEESRTPLLDAVEYRHPAIVTALLDAGADVRAATEHGMTALHVLLKASSVKAGPGSGGMLRGVPATCSQSEWSARGAATLATLCAAPGLPVNALDSRGWTPLLLAADSGDAAAIRALVAAGAAVDSWGGLAMGPPLELALRRGHAEAALVLQQAGATRA